MQSVSGDGLRYKVQFPVPLAVYREIVAHLGQVEGVAAGLNPQVSQEFDYNQSQVGSLWIHYSEAASSEIHEQVNRILAYYQSRYREQGDRRTRG